ncbi:MAG: DUF115 domain-containing protein [Candidatus Thermoplasmatota archaeon]|nr:DUF115 domain-containing protein [Candidatus Thermoplasmatota archaeon]
MNTDQWEHFYREICLDLGIDPESDFRSAQLLESIVGEKSDAELIEKYRGNAFYVIGNGTNLTEALPLIGDGTTIVADSAVKTFMGTGRTPDLVVTDLDGGITSLRQAYRKGATMIVHAHGDNQDRIVKYAKEFSGRMVGTTQNKPLEHIFNFFGFTDGDRGAYLADYLHAGEIYLVGFDFSIAVSKKNTDPERKLKKLKWAKILLEELAMERGKTLENGPLIPL